MSESSSDSQPDDSTETDSPPSREAAKWRRKLREAEGQRDALISQIEVLQRAQADAAIEADGLKPDAVWATGTELADLLTDDGAVDSDKVRAAVTAAREEFGIHPKPFRGMSGLRSGSQNPPQPFTWADAFAPRN